MAVILQQLTYRKTNAFSRQHLAILLVHIAQAHYGTEAGVRRQFVSQFLSIDTSN